MYLEYLSTYTHLYCSLRVCTIAGAVIQLLSAPQECIFDIKRAAIPLEAVANLHYHRKVVVEKRS